MGTAVAGFKTTLDVSGSAVAFTTLALSEINDNLWEVGSADDAKSVWNPSASFTVEASEDSGSTYATLGAAEYELNYLAGRVDVTNYASGTSNTANITDVRISGDYLPRYTEADAYSTDVNLSFSPLDSTTFSDTDMARVKGLADVDLSVSTLQFGRTPLDGVADTEDELIEILGNGRLVVVSVQLTTDTERYIRAFARLDQVNVSSSVDGRVEGEINFVGHLPANALTSHTIFTRGTA